MWFVSILNYTSVILIVDLKIGMYTKTWTILNWASIVVCSLFIYIGFTFVGDYLSFFNSNHTVLTMYKSWQFYLLNFLFIVSAYLYDQIVLIWEKELHTPLSILYRSIRLRYQAEAEHYFEKVIKIKPYEKGFNKQSALLALAQSSPQLVNKNSSFRPSFVNQPNPSESAALR